MPRLILTYLVVGALFLARGAVGADCSIFARLVMSPEERAQLTEAELVVRGADGFAAALEVKQAAYGERPNEGRSLTIQDTFKQAIRRSAYDALTAATRGPNPDLIAVGNKGHQSDHTALWRENNRPSEQFPKGAIRDLFGVDAKDLYLVKLVHDLGKLPETEATAHLRAFVRSKTNNDFLKTRILAHGFDSIARVAEIVQREGDRLGIPKSEQLDAFLQLSDAIAWHNFGPVADKAEATRRYPSLTAQEIDTLTSAFWPTFFNNGIKTPDGKVIVSAFKDDLGIPAYGSSRDRGVLQKLLTLDDRAALVTEKAPDKIGNQNLKAGDPTALTFNRKLLTDTFISPANQTIAAVKAMADELRPHVVDSRFSVEDYPTYQTGMRLSNKLKALGESLVEMNSEARLAELGVTGEQAKHTIVFQQSDGTWWRIDGSNKTEPKRSVLIGTTWHEASPSKGTAFDQLMQLIRKDGRW